MIKPMRVGPDLYVQFQYTFWHACINQLMINQFNVFIQIDMFGHNCFTSGK